jgi:hypothetical protein
MDFFHRHLPPLQAHLRPAWFYTGDNDECRLACGTKFNHSEEVVVSWMDQAMEVKDMAVALLPEEIQALWENLRRHAVLDSLPATDALGLVSVCPQQDGRRASGHGGGTQAAPLGGFVIREGSSNPAACATSLAASEGRTPGAPEGASDPLGKSNHRRSPSPVQVDSSSSSTLSSL